MSWRLRATTPTSRRLSWIALVRGELLNNIYIEPAPDILQAWLPDALLAVGLLDSKYHIPAIRPIAVRAPFQHQHLHQPPIGP